MKRLHFTVSVLVIFSLLSTVFSIDVSAIQSELSSGGQVLKELVSAETTDISTYTESNAESTAYLQSVYLSNVMKENDEMCADYGGAYINENNTLVVLLKGNSSTITINSIKSIMNEDVDYKNCLYSLSELEALKDYISGFWEIETEDAKLKDLISSLVGVGIYEHKNKVFVEIVNCTLERVNLFKKYISSSDCIIFENVSEYQNEVSLEPGDLVSFYPDPDSSGHFNGSIGFRCRKLRSSGDYVNGFMTAGHSLTVGSDVHNSNGEYTGYILSRSYHNNNIVDGSFVYVTNTSDSLSNRIGHGNHTLTAGAYVNSFVTGKTVYKAGYATGLTTGQITSTSYNNRSSDGITIQDCVKATYQSSGGDSGGLIYMVVDGKSCVAGIHRGSATESSGNTFAVFVKVSNLKSVFNIVLY